MGPPRLQCLNASRQALKKFRGSKAAFSTSQPSRNDERPRNTNTASDLLSALEDVKPSQSTRRDSLNSFKLPSGNKPPSFERRSTASTPPRSNPSASVSRLIANAAQRHASRKVDRRAGELSQDTSERVRNSALSQALSQQITRRWKQGDVYAPHDLSGVEMAKWKRRGRPVQDAFDVLDFKPQDSYSNFSIMSEYMTPMGRIRHSKETGLRPVNQRRIARAIRRSIGMGLMPSVYKHPEILHKREVKSQQLSPFRPHSPM